MARLGACFYVAVATVMAQQVAPVALLHIPAAWGYHLTPTCYWKPQRWAYALGYSLPAQPRLDAAARRAAWGCQHRRGLKSMVIFHAQVLPRWPEPATIAKWETEDAQDRDPPAADWRLMPERD